MTEAELSLQVLTKGMRKPNRMTTKLAATREVCFSKGDLIMCVCVCVWGGGGGGLCLCMGMERVGRVEDGNEGGMRVGRV